MRRLDCLFLLFFHLHLISAAIDPYESGNILHKLLQLKRNQSKLLFLHDDDDLNNLHKILLPNPLSQRSASDPAVTSPPASNTSSSASPSTGNTSASVVTNTTLSTSQQTTPSTEPTITIGPRNCLEPGTVCLVGNNTDFRGNVMVGMAPVCDDSWSLESATVVCRELGYHKAKKWFVKSTFGNSTVEFSMDNVKCNGTESRLQDCDHNKQNDCGPGEVAGVECDTRNFTEILKSECYELDFIYLGGSDNTKLSNVSSPEDCQNNCKNSSSCNYFSYIPSIQRCYLRRGSTKSFKDGAISGPKSCENETQAASGVVESCYEPGIGYNYGEYLDYGFTDDVTTCQQRCQAYSGCTFFSFYQSSQECFMKTGKEYKRKHNDVTSGPKFCPGDANSTAASNRHANCYKAGKVCLLGGVEDNQGNVHVGGKPVCDDSWDLKDGHVLCKELGYHAVVKITKESTYGKVNPDFAMDNVGCLGTEESIKNCTFNRDDDCGASEGAGVICDTRSKAEIDAELRLIQVCFDEGVSYTYGDFIDFEVSYSPLACQKHCQLHADCSHFTFYPESGRCYRKTGDAKRSTDGAISGPKNCSDPDATTARPGTTTPATCSSPGAICLSGGSSDSEGNVLVENRPVCDDDWNLINAHVACKQLGYIGAISFTRESRFGITTANFSMDNVKCDGTEERLIDCASVRLHDCGEGEAAGVVCDARTVDEEEVLELSCFKPGVSYSPGNWIDYDVTLTAFDCQVHCQSHPECKHFSFYKDTQKCYRKTSNNGFPSAAAISGPRQCNSSSTTSSSAVSVTGSVVTTTQQTTTTERNCNVPGVVCLKQGSSPGEGNVYVGGKPVCDDSWDTRDARVVCHELGYPDVLVTYIESHFGAVPETYAMDNVECTGDETKLGVCSHSQVDDCGPTEGAGVKCDNGTQMQIPEDCKEAGKICLIGGNDDSEGNVFFGGKPICDDGWSFANAHVVCLTLGFAEAVTALKESHYGIVSSRYGASDVSCTGEESNFSICHMSTEQINCNRMEGAGVKCRRERRNAASSDTSAGNGSWSAGGVVAVLLLVITVCATAGLLFNYRERLFHVVGRELFVRLSGSGPLLS